MAGERTQRVGTPPLKQLTQDEVLAFLATDLFAKRCRKLAALFSTVEEACGPNGLLACLPALTRM